MERASTACYRHFSGGRRGPLLTTNAAARATTIITQITGGADAKHREKLRLKKYGKDRFIPSSPAAIVIPCIGAYPFTCQGKLPPRPVFGISFVAEHLLFLASCSF